MSLSTLADKYCPTVCRPVLNRVQQSPIGKRIVSGTFWSVVGNGLGKMFTFIAMVLVARMLGKEAFGEFGLVRSTAMMFVTFSSFGMGLTATKYIAELLHTDKERTGRIIGLTYVFTFFTSLIVAIVFYLISPWLCETQLNASQLTNVMKLGTILLFLSTFMGTQISVMTGFQDFRGLALATLISNGIMLPIYVIGTYYWGLYGGISGAIIAVFLNILINSRFIHRNIKKYDIRYVFRKIYSELSILVQSNLPIASIMIICTFVYWLMQLMLYSSLNGPQECGVYYMAFTYRQVILGLPALLQPVFLPILCETDKNKQQHWKVIKVNLQVVTICILITSIPFLIFPKWLIGLSGNDFIENWNILWIICLWCTLNLLNHVLQQVLISLHRCWLLFVCIMIAIFIYCLSAYYLLQNGWGALGLLLAASIETFSSFIIMAAALILMKQKNAQPMLSIDR